MWSSGQWAVCYRVVTPMNANMYAESFHRVLKIVYLEHKQNRRIDYLIYILLKIAKDKAFEQLQKALKGKVTQRIGDINKRHKTALSFVSLAIIQVMGENKYKVSSHHTDKQPNLRPAGRPTGRCTGAPAVHYATRCRSATLSTSNHTNCPSPPDRHSHWPSSHALAQHHLNHYQPVLDLLATGRHLAVGTRNTTSLPCIPDCHGSPPTPLETSPQ